MAKVKSSSGTPKRRRPAMTPEARENQLISYAMDLVEQRLLDGTASSQEVTHFLKLGSIKAQTELEKTKYETKLVEAKTEAIQSQKKVEALYEEAITAFRSYNGQGDPDEY